MNTVHKHVFIGLLFAISTTCVYSSDQQAQKNSVQLCDKAKYGQLSIENTPITDPYINAYLLDCAVSVVISEVSFHSGPHKGNNVNKKNKKIIANHFLSQTLDLSYRNNDGDNVLMSVITSFLPEVWKEKAVITLLEKGIDLKEKNHNGDSALDIARFKGNKRIIKLVSY